MSEQTNFKQSSLISLMMKKVEGKYKEYKTDALMASEHDPAFLAHCIAWNNKTGQVRDTKVALPILALRNLTNKDSELAENAIAHLMLLDPRNLVKAYNFNKELSKEGLVISGGWRRMLEDAIKKYVLLREENKNWFERTVLQHRASLKHLYAVSHLKPNEYAQKVLFEKEYPKGSIFDIVANLKNMSAEEAAGQILQHNLPTQIVLGALGRSKEDMVKDPTLIMALMDNMSGQQFINGAKFLTSLGVSKDPVLRSQYLEKFEKAVADVKVSTFKAGTAIEALKKVVDSSSDDMKEIIENLSTLQEKKIDATCSIDGDWLVLGDCSGSMNQAIEVSKMISSVLARSVKGKIYLCFFNTSPRIMDVTGKTFEEIKEATKYIRADGGTSCGCGIAYLQHHNVLVNGIVLVSDGGDNTTPRFSEAYRDYTEKMLINPTVYYYELIGEPDNVMCGCMYAGIPVNHFDLRSGVDYSTIPNLVATMKTNHYGLVDEIMNVPLLTLNDVWKSHY